MATMVPVLIDCELDLFPPNDGTVVVAFAGKVAVPVVEGAVVTVSVV